MSFDHLPWYARSWDFFRNWKAIGSLPFLTTTDQARAVAAGWGFWQSHPGPGIERWQHPDGSYMEFIYGRARPKIGWHCDEWQCDFDLGRLPFNNRLG
jgi:hypothetical protein